MRQLTNFSKPEKVISVNDSDCRKHKRRSTKNEDAENNYKEFEEMNKEKYNTSSNENLPKGRLKLPRSLDASIVYIGTKG